MRAEPFVRFSDDGVARLGLSGQYLQADLPAGTEDVFRGAVDVAVIRGGNDYVLVGGEYRRGPLVGRYNFSHGRYNDEDVTETIHEPAIGYTASENLAVLAELVLWNRSAPDGDSTVDRSLNVTLHGHF